LWNHRALILWKDFEDLPYVMENGFKGKEAIWLQKNLRLLGFYKGREAASFGPKTEQAVKNYQRRYNIKDDGRFDTESKLMLYNLLNIYPTPKLIKR
jgi:peptidoglycan hydrolase-like protein with peptidoglycan-binding domain